MSGAASSAAKPGFSFGGKAVPHYALIMGCTMIATLMQALDNTIANVVLPHLQGSLSASRDQVTWTLTAYIIAAAIMTAPTGWLAGRFGRKNLFVVCLAGFTLASMACGAAQTIEEMVLFRFVQGCFGAALVPLSQSLILDITPPEKRGSAMAIWGMGVMVGPILGPTLGGWLTDVYSWRWCFYINVPFGIAATAGIVLFLHEESRDVKMRFDWIGFSMLSIALASMQLFLDRGTTKEWFSSPEIVVEAVIAGLCAYLFLVQMFTTDSSFIPRRIFKDVGFLTGFFVMFVVGAVLMASSALLPPYLQTLGGYSVTQAGLLMTPRGIGTMVAMAISGRMRKTDPRLVVGIGVACMAFPLWDMASWTPDVSAARLAIVTAIQGAGIGLVFLALQVVGFATLDPSLRTNGTALFALIRSIGGAIGISITTVVLADSMQTAHAYMAESVTLLNRPLNSGMQGLYLSPQTPFGLANAETAIEHQAAIVAYANDFKLMFLLCLPMFLLLLVMKKPKPDANAGAAPAPEELAME